MVACSSPCDGSVPLPVALYTQCDGDCGMTSTPALRAHGMSHSIPSAMGIAGRPGGRDMLREMLSHSTPSAMGIAGGCCRRCVALGAQCDGLCSMLGFQSRCRKRDDRFLEAWPR